MINIIAAATANNVIGRNGAIPWHLPADLKHFKTTTMGAPVIMGRVTFESIVNFLGTPLPGRTNIVISRRHTFTEFDEVETFDSLEEALRFTEGDDEVFILGGARVYQEAFPLADRIYLTRVHIELEGDTFFPEIDTDVWKLMNEEKHTLDEKNPFNYTFLTYERK